MKDSFYLRCTAVIAFAFMLQSCSKNGDHMGSQFREDKLLLSKVTGKLGTNDPDFFYALVNLSNTYRWSSLDPVSGSYDTGKYQIDYSYAKDRQNWGDEKAIYLESFLNAGHYDFNYNGPFPEKVIDNSLPGKDQGYWKMYYDGSRQVQKVGLAFSSASEPTRFEFYTRDWRGQISSFIYGKAIDTPYMNVQYQYNDRGNISNFAIYIKKTGFPGVGTSVAPSNSALVARANSFGSGLKDDFPLSRIQTAKHKNSTVNVNVLDAPILSNPAAFGTNPDTSVYILFLTAKVSTDEGINPYSQQGNVFFYQTNRWFWFWDMDPFFESLLKSNPVKIEYQVPYWTTVWGQADVSAVQTFTYSYNKWGYPVTVHEDFKDPNFVLNGNYTRDSQIEYIKNE